MATVLDDLKEKYKAMRAALIEDYNKSDLSAKEYHALNPEASIILKYRYITGVVDLTISIPFDVLITDADFIETFFSMDLFINKQE